MQPQDSGISSRELTPCASPHLRVLIWNEFLLQYAAKGIQSYQKLPKTHINLYLQTGNVQYSYKPTFSSSY